MAKKKEKKKDEKIPTVAPNQGKPVAAQAVTKAVEAMTPLEKAKAQAADIVEKAESVDKEQKKLDKDFKSAKETVFVSQFAEHLIRVEPIDVQVDNMGRKRIINRGSTIQFHNKIYRTSDPKEIEAIEKNPAFGSVINVAKVAPEQIKKEVATQIST